MQRAGTASHAVTVAHRCALSWPRARAAQALPDEADPPDRAVPAGRRGRFLRARRAAAAVRGARPAGRHREQGRARAAWSAPRRSRRRRPTATRCCSATSRRSRSTSASTRRCPTTRVKDLTPIIAHGRRQLRAGRASVGAGEDGAGAHRLREGQSRQARRTARRAAAACRTSRPSSSRRRRAPTSCTCPYKGGGPMVTDLLGGSVQLVIADQANLMPHVKSGQAARARGRDARSARPTCPSCPRSPSRLPGFEATAWHGLVGPAGPAARHRRRLNEAFNKVMAMPDGAREARRAAGSSRRRHARASSGASSAPRSPSGRRSRRTSARRRTDAPPRHAAHPPWTTTPTPVLEAGHR